MAIVTIAMYAMKKVFGAVALDILKESMQPGHSGKQSRFRYPIQIVCLISKAEIYNWYPCAGAEPQTSA